MKNLNKKVWFVMATALLLSPAFVMADQSMSNDYWMTQSSDSSVQKQSDYECKEVGTRSEWYYDKEGKLIKYAFCGNSQNNIEISDEQKKQIEYLKAALESSLKSLKETITPENFEEIKIKAETLKAEFIQKAKSLELPNVVNMVEWRFKVFMEINLLKKEELKKLYDEKKQQFGQVKDEMKQNVNEVKEKFNAQQEKFQEMKKEIKSNITPEQKAKIEELRKTLEESIKALRESVTPENFEEIKTKAENLKAEYLAKADELGLVEMKKMIEERFNIFSQNQFVKKPEIKKEKEEAKQKVWEIKQQFQVKKQDLVMKYKEQFAKSLESKLAKLSSEKMKAVIVKIDVAIEKYNSNTKLTSIQKEKYISQLTGLKELLQEKIDELENGVNIDELLAE